jgi:hypothetical protein
LAEFNQRLLQASKGQLEANQASAADILLAKVENQSTLQQVETSRQEYSLTLTDPLNAVGATPQIAVIPDGELILRIGFIEGLFSLVGCSVFFRKCEKH